MERGRLGAERPIDHDRCQTRHQRREKIQVPNRGGRAKLRLGLSQYIGDFFADGAGHVRGVRRHLNLHHLRTGGERRRHDPFGFRFGLRSPSFQHGFQCRTIVLKEGLLRVPTLGQQPHVQGVHNENRILSVQGHAMFRRNLFQEVIGGIVAHYSTGTAENCSKSCFLMIDNRCRSMIMIVDDAMASSNVK